MIPPWRRTPHTPLGGRRGDFCCGIDQLRRCKARWSDGKLCDCGKGSRPADDYCARVHHRVAADRRSLHTCGSAGKLLVRGVRTCARVRVVGLRRIGRFVSLVLVRSRIPSGSPRVLIRNGEHHWHLPSCESCVISLFCRSAKYDVRHSLLPCRRALAEGPEGRSFDRSDISTSGN